jgi:hypothetical protein
MGLEHRSVPWLTCQLVVLAICQAGCAAPVAPDSDGELAGSNEPITNGTAASQFYWSRAALFGGCTGTKIAQRYILTASHCRVKRGDDVRFYTTGPKPDKPSGTVADVFVRSGVYPSIGDYTDSNGNFADIAVVELASPAGGHVATLEWQFPGGGDAWGTKVGAAEPVTVTWENGLPITHQDPPYKLRSIMDQVYSDNDNDGHFLTENEQADPGDSGGAFYDDLRLLGVLYGEAFEWEWRDKYTSVPAHLGWILKKIGYAWSGQAVDAGLWRNGSVVQALIGTSETICQYACWRTSECAAYTFMSTGSFSFCYLLSNVSESYSNTLARSALK